ncbi:regulator of g protein signaling [Anaeramoeba flamelloides]|uniref:Regulator of g protein signaling n=1 Tax=Anaeramoeba flamelloides TaxID=1746091 RepID=A0AAV7ZIV5_9EUKA|nr:regulator of g protein signaling [Anaeramoeba flamelloides]
MSLIKIGFFIEVFAVVLLQIWSTLRRHYQPISSRSQVVSIFYTVFVIAYLLIWYFYAVDLLKSYCIIFTICMTSSPNMNLIIYYCRSYRLYGIFRQNHHKLAQAKKIYFNIFQTTEERKNSNNPKIDGNFLDSDNSNNQTSEYSQKIPLLNSGTELYEEKFDTSEDSDEFSYNKLEAEFEALEKNFFYKQWKINEKTFLLAISIFFLITVALGIFLYMLTDINKQKNCLPTEFNNGRITGYCFFTMNMLILCYSLFKIHTIKDNFFIRNEIYAQFVINVLYYIPASYFLYNKKIQSLLILTLAFIAILVFVYLALPLIYSYKRQKRSQKMTERVNTYTNSETGNGSSSSLGLGSCSDSNYDQDIQYPLSNKLKKMLIILENPSKRNFWIKWAQKNFSAENISFYSLVRSFQNEKKIKNRIKLAHQIFNKYIKNGSMSQINISYPARELTTELYNNDASKNTIFDKALDEIIKLMFYDSYPFFLKSQENYDLLVYDTQIDPNSYLMKNMEK